MRIFQTLLQIVLIIIVGWFGWHYLTREELRSCVTVPLSSWRGKGGEAMVDQEKVDTFMTEMARGLGQVASRGGELAQLWQGVDVGVATREGDLLDKGQYLYCKAVVNKVEGELLN